MKPLSKIWAISQGAYSDYRVEVVFEDEQTAKAWIAALAPDGETGGYNDPKLEDFPFIPSGEPPRIKTIYRAACYLMPNGIAEDESISCERSLWLYGEDADDPVKASYWHSYSTKIHLTVRGSSQEAVLKSFSERKARWLAGERSIKSE